MPVKIYAFSFCLVLLSFSGRCQNELSPQQENLYQKAVTEIRPAHANWIRRTGMITYRDSLSEEKLRSLAIVYGRQNHLNDQGIEALVMLTLMQAAKSAQDDLKALAEEIRKKNEAKKQLSALMEEMRSAREITRLNMDSVKTAYAAIGNPKIANLSTTANAKQVNAPAKNQKVSQQEIDAAKSDIQRKLDSLSQTQEMNGLRLQLAMDRRSKFISTLSNILKKLGETQNSIIENLK